MEKEKSKYSAQIKYAKRKKIVKIVIDVQEDFRIKFHEACNYNNTNASKVLKDFISDYIKKYEKKL